MKKHTLTTLFTDFSINKSILLLALMLVLSSCKKDPVALSEKEMVLETLTSKTLTESINCNGETYNFEMPYFKATPSQEAIIHNELIDLISPYISENTITEDRNFEDIFSDFVSARKKSLCDNTKQGISDIKVVHITQNDAILSYEITYKLDDTPRRIMRAYKKPDLSLLTLKNLVKKERMSDVQRIMDINTQNGVIDLALQIPSENQQVFRDFSMNTAFTYDNILENEIPMGVHMNKEGKMMLQFPKTVELPKEYPELNGDINIEIEAQQMAYYLNLSIVGG